MATNETSARRRHPGHDGRRVPRAWLAVAAVIACLGATRTAEAHKVGLSRGDYHLRGTNVEAELTFERTEVATLAPSADANHDGALDDAELAAARPLLDAALVGKVLVRGDGAPCVGKLSGARAVEGDGVLVSATYACASRPKKLGVAIGFFDALAHGHRHLAVLTGGGASVDAVAYAANPGFSLDVGAGADAGPASPAVPAKEGDTGNVGLFRLGIEHILTGYDHLLFLFALILVGGRVRSLVAVVTAFTLAHSITLGLAALGVWAPSPRFVEPMIALSIAYVGVENFFTKSADKRWRITFPFGLVHGFGFAGALQEIALPRDRVPAALLLFNLGVEAGQLAVLAVVLPLVLWLRKREWFVDRGVRVLSTLVVIAGVFWFVQRVAAG